MLFSSILKIFLLCSLTFIFGCQKDSPVLGNCPTCADEECHDFIWQGNINYEDYIVTGIQYRQPAFNPLNGDEFVYVKLIPNGSFFNYDLVKHVISSGQEAVLCSSEIITGQPQWGEQGVIVFSVYGNKIMKINEDGTGLAQITPDGIEYHKPIFESGGNRFFVTGTSTSVNGDYLPIFNLSGVIVDSVKFKFGNNQIGYPYCSDGSMKNGYYTYADISSSPAQFSYCKLLDNISIEKVYDLEMPNGLGFPTSICKNSKKLFFTQFQKGLFGLNLTNGSVEKIITNCQSKYITSLSMSPNGDYIIYEQVKGVQTGVDQEIDEQSEIFIMHVLTHKKTKIIGE